MKNEPEAIALAFVKAINRQDVNALVELMAPSHRFIDSLGGVTEGRDAMRAGWVGYFRMVPDYAIEIKDTYCDGQVFVMLGVVGGTYAPDSRLSEENRWQTPAALRAVIEDGKVAEWRVYADNEPIRQLIAKRG
jgi:ketosteroid isomerase-like protein